MRVVFRLIPGLEDMVKFFHKLSSLRIVFYMEPSVIHGGNGGGGDDND